MCQELCLSASDILFSFKQSFEESIIVLPARWLSWEVAEQEIRVRLALGPTFSNSALICPGIQVSDNRGYLSKL